MTFETFTETRTVRERVLHFLTEGGGAGAEFTIAEMAEEVDSSVASAQIALKDLYDHGLLTRRYIDAGVRQARGDKSWVVLTYAYRSKGNQ